MADGDPDDTAKTLPWVIFDADNTLWDVESLYDEARRRLGRLLAPESDGRYSPEQVERLQDERDRELSSVYGYSGDRFRRSFEDTALVVLGTTDVAQLTPEQVDLVRACRDLARNVFEQRAQSYPGIVQTLKAIRAKGYRVGILTAGEEWVQTRRLQQASVGPFCDSVQIVPFKDEAGKALGIFCTNKRVEVARSWIVGDSLRSDIGPGNKVGLKTIHIPNRNWDGGSGADTVRPTYSADALSDVPRLIPALDQTPPAVGARVKPETLVHLVFEGGGAKGIAHIGALKALEEYPHIKVDRVVGSSAGAIMAALISSGYTADDLLKIKDGGCYGIFSDPVEEMLEINDLAMLDRVFWISKLGKLGLLAALIYGNLVLNNRHGILRSGRLADWIDRRLCQRFGKPAGNLTFADMEERGPVIVASDVSGQRISVLKWREHPANEQEVNINNMRIADAVTASAAIPVVFEHGLVPGEKVEIEAAAVDGGLLSNFPAWTFEEGREMPGERTPILGFSLVEKSPGNTDLLAFKSYLGAIASTVVGGVRTMETRGIEGLHTFPLRVSVSPYKFELSDDEKADAYQEGYDDARKHLSEEVALALAPKAQMTIILDEAINQLQDALDRHGSDQLEVLRWLPDQPVHIRSNIMRVTSLKRLRVTYSSSMSGDNDDDLELPLTSGATGIALKEREVMLTDMTDARYGYQEFRMTKYQQALVRPSLKTLISIPLIDGDEPVGVLSFDSDDDLLPCFQENDQLLEYMEKIGIAVLAMWKSVAGLPKSSCR